MSMLILYKSHIPSVNYLFKSGKPAIFIGGRFATSIQSEIDELNAEVAAGHPHIHIDDLEKEVDSVAVDPIAVLKERLREELRTEMAAATDPTNDRGTSKQEPLKPASSADIAEAAAGGSGSALAARLVNLTSKK